MCCVDTLFLILHFSHLRQIRRDTDNHSIAQISQVRRITPVLQCRYDQCPISIEYIRRQTNALQVPAEQLADIERLIQRRKKLSVVDRVIQDAEAASNSVIFRPSSHSPVPDLIVSHPTSSTLASLSRSTPSSPHMPHNIFGSGSTTLREATASPAPSNLTQVTQSSSTASLDYHRTSPTSSPSRNRKDSGDKWQNVFKKKNSKGKDKEKLTDEEFQRLEAETDGAFPPLFHPSLIIDIPA